MIYRCSVVFCILLVCLLSSPLLIASDDMADVAAEIEEQGGGENIDGGEGYVGIGAGGGSGSGTGESESIQVENETLKVTASGSKSEFPGYLDASQFSSEELQGMNDPSSHQIPAGRPYSPNTPESWQTSQYIDHYLNENKGDTKKAWADSYDDRQFERKPFDNKWRRDAEHYLWSYDDVSKNNYQWAPAIVRATGYSAVKYGQYYGTEVYNGGRQAVGLAPVVNDTTKPTISELGWGIKGANDALFGRDKQQPVGNNGMGIPTSP